MGGGHTSCSIYCSRRSGYYLFLERRLQHVRRKHSQGFRMIPVTFLSATTGGGGFTPITHTYNSGSGTENVPTGAAQVVITCYGQGGLGGSGILTAKAAGGGG